MHKLILLAILLGTASSSFGMAYYAPMDEMVRNAACIVVVDITRIENTERQGQHWTYGQKATAKVEQCIKGRAQGRIEIYGMESFLCATNRYQKGRFLLFLQKDGELWVGANWHLGIRPITGDNVEWFWDNSANLMMLATPLDQVVAEINDVLAGKR